MDTPSAAQIDPVTEELRQLGLPPLTDAGNAERFAACNALIVRYAHKWDVWLVWDGRRWGIDHRREVYRLAVDCVRLIKGDVPALSNKAAEGVVKHAVRSERKDRLEAMLGLARTYEPLAVTPEVLDRDVFAFNAGNGTVDLKTGELRPHRHDALQTKLVAIDFVTDAEAPTWRAFLDRVVPDAAVREYLQRAVGYSLTGDVGEHCLFFCYGTGRNGKSTFLETVRTLLGEYAKASSPDLLLAKKADRHQEELAELHGARFVTTVEAGEGRYWDEARVKWLTGGDKLTARHMYASRFEFGNRSRVGLRQGSARATCGA
jgi:putative DNA primase/helicase